MQQNLPLEVDGVMRKFGSAGLMVQVYVERELRRMYLQQFELAAQIVKNAGPDIAGRVLAEAYRIFANSTIITQGEVAAFMDSATGRMFHFRLALRIFDNAITDADADAIYAKVTVEQWNQLDTFWTESISGKPAKQDDPKPIEPNAQGG
jgi:hypothetical protein